CRRPAGGYVGASPDCTAAPAGPRSRRSGAYILHSCPLCRTYNSSGGGSSMKRIALLSVAFAAMLTIGCRGDRPHDNAANPNEAVGTAGKKEAAKPADRGTQFVEHMMMDGMAEVQLGKLASERAQNANVKQFAQTMVRDHSKAGDELKQITDRNN